MANRVVEIRTDDLKASVYIVEDEDIVHDDGKCIKFKYYDTKDRAGVFYAQQIFIKVDSEETKEGYKIYTCVTEAEFNEIKLIRDMGW